MEQLASVLKEIKEQSNSYAQVTISGDLFSRLLSAAKEMRQDYSQMEQDCHSQRVQLRKLEALQRDWDAKAELADTHMANWANQLTEGMNFVKAQILREQEITSMWIGHVQREKEKNRFLESNMKIRNEEFSNLKVEFATVSEALRKSRGEFEIVHSAYEKSHKNESIAFQKKAEAEKEVKNQMKLREQMILEQKSQREQWEASMKAIQAELDQVRSQQARRDLESGKLESSARESHEALTRLTNDLNEAQGQIQKDIKLFKWISGMLTKGFTGKNVDFDAIKEVLEIKDLPKMRISYLDCIKEHAELKKENLSLKSQCDKLTKQLADVKSQLQELEQSKDKKNVKIGNLDEEKPRVSPGRVSPNARDTKSSSNRAPSRQAPVKMDEELPVQPPKPATKKKKGAASKKTEPSEKAGLRDESNASIRSPSRVSNTSEAADEGKTPKKETKGKNTGKGGKKTQASKAGAKSKASKATKSEAADEENELDPLGDEKKVSRRSHSVDAKKMNEPASIAPVQRQVIDPASAQNAAAFRMSSANKDNRFSSDLKRILCNHPQGPDPHCEYCRAMGSALPAFGGLSTLSGLAKASKKR